jgi:hypothetical protein
MNEYKPDYITHPLETVIETLSYYGIAFSDLFIDGLDFGYWQDYAHDTVPLTDTAVQVVEKVTGIPSEYMRRLDQQYQERGV